MDFQLNISSSAIIGDNSPIVYETEEKDNRKTPDFDSKDNINEDKVFVQDFQTQH